MNRALLLLALCAVATAFAPGAGVARSATRVASSTRNLDSMVGGDVETGGAWDPLGFSQIGDYSEKYGDGIKGLGDGVFPHVKWLREAEIKHGRICMLAFMGIWGYSVLGPLKGAFGADTFYNGAFYEAVPWDQAIASATKTNPVGMIQVIAVIAIIEGHFFSGGALPSPSPPPLPPPSSHAPLPCPVPFQTSGAALATARPATRGCAGCPRRGTLRR